jgi:hypothetical protein
MTGNIGLAVKNTRWNPSTEELNHLPRDVSASTPCLVWSDHFAIAQNEVLQNPDVCAKRAGSIFGGSSCCTDNPEGGNDAM